MRMRTHSGPRWPRLFATACVKRRSRRSALLQRQYTTMLQMPLRAVGEALIRVVLYCIVAKPLTSI